MNLKQYLAKAKEEKWAIGQFNFSTLDQLKGTLAALSELKSPAILGTSEGESKFFGLEEAVALCKVFQKKYDLPVFLNLDHGRDLDYVKKTIDSGYDAVHFDGSSLELGENIKETKTVAGWAKRKGIAVEGEIGTIKGESSVHKEKIEVSASDLAGVNDVAEFVKKTGVDTIAVAVGTTHGIYANEQGINFERLEEISKAVNLPLVLHGGSGVLEADIKKAISLGIAKINFNTEIRQVWKESLAKALADSEDFKPYKILPQVIDAIKEKVKEKIFILGSANRA